MAIDTNPNFDAQNAALEKRPLYVVEIEGVLDPLTTFRPQDWEVALTGYGMSGYGTTGYGT